MNISKSEFKIIFNKMMHTSYDENMRMIKKISNEGKTGDEQIDTIINGYSSEYINKIMNKIINRGLIGGQTSEQPNDQKPSSNSNLVVPGLSASATSVVPPSTVAIIDKVTGSIDKPLSVSKQSDSTTSSDVFMPASPTSPTSEKKDLVSSATSSAIPSNIVQSTTSDVFIASKPKESNTDSATSSVMPSSIIPSSTSDVFISSKQKQSNTDSVTSSVMPSSIIPSTTSDIFIPVNSVKESKTDSATSSAMPSNVNALVSNSPTSSENRTTTDIPNANSVSKSDISDVFGSPTKLDDKAKMSPKKAIELVIKKNELLKEKEAILKNKEEELKNREALVVQVEQDAKVKMEKINKEIEDLNKTKSELEASIAKLKDEKKSLDNSLSEIELSLSDVDKLQTTDSDNQTKSILKKIFG